MITEPAILTLDLSTTTGWALAEPPAVAAWPQSVPGIKGPIEGVSYGIMSFKSVYATAGSRFSAFSDWLCNMLTDQVPGLVVFEAPVIGRGLSASRLAAGMASIVELMCWRREIAHYEVSPQTVKKHFAGSGRAQKRDVIEACRQRGWDPQDDNAADALALLDYAVRVWQASRRGAA